MLFFFFLFLLNQIIKHRSLTVFFLIYKQRGLNHSRIILSLSSHINKPQLILLLLKKPTIFSLNLLIFLNKIEQLN